MRKENGECMQRMDTMRDDAQRMRTEMDALLKKHRQELEEIEAAHRDESEMAKENDRKQILALNEDIVTYKNDIAKLGNGRTDLLQQIKMLSDVNEEWEQKFTVLEQEYFFTKVKKRKRI